MTLTDLENNDLILLKCISGSKAYNLDVATSDTDIKGVFYLPKEKFYGFDSIPQVADEKNDVVYYELGRYFELLLKNNPNILELLATPKDKILYKHPLLEQVTPEMFLSKKCKDTFGGYAFTQIRKARGLNKKIVNPIGKEKKNILEFCQVLEKQGSMPLLKWLDLHQLNQENIGLVNVPNFKDAYGLYYDKSGQFGYKGIMKKEKATTVLLSSIPKSEKPLTYLQFNQDGYIKYCKDYREYWDWVDKRNDARYQNNLTHGKNYDSKNMMHTFRLLDMAEEILTEKVIKVKRPNREELLSIRRGESDYDALIEQAELKMEKINAAFPECTLPEEPNRQAIEALLIDIRQALYD